MEPHTARRVDTHCGNVAVRPCTQTDKVAIAVSCRPINFPQHSFMGCAFLFCCWGFIWGQQWRHPHILALAQSGLRPQCIGSHMRN